MTLTRRSALMLVGGVGLALPFAPPAAQTTLATPTPIDVRAYPLPFFSISEHDRVRFDGLEFRSGLELQSSHEAFGGFSGLWRSPDGGRIVAITDNGTWLTAEVVVREGRLAGLERARLAPMLDPDGRPLRQTRDYDTEALAIAGGIAFVGIERSQKLMRYDYGRDGTAARGRFIESPMAMRAWPRNKGPEGIAVAPPDHPLAGSLVVVAERARWAESAPTEGVVTSGPRAGTFKIVRSGEFEATDIAFLPDGDLLLLERRFSLLRGVGTRIRRLPGSRIAPGAVLDGPIVFEAGAGHQIDNFEGLAVHVNAAGETILTLVSDDNFSVLQRTLLLEFALLRD